MRPPEERTVMKQAAELLQQALSEAGGSLADVANEIKDPPKPEPKSEPSEKKPEPKEEAKPKPEPVPEQIKQVLCQSYIERKAQAVVKISDDPAVQSFFDSVKV